MKGETAGFPFFRSTAAADANAAGRTAAARVIRTVCGGTVDRHGLIRNRADHRIGKRSVLLGNVGRTAGLLAVEGHRSRHPDIGQAAKISGVICTGIYVTLQFRHDATPHFELMLLVFA